MKADCHMHMVLDGVDWRSAIRRHENGPDISFIRRILAAYQARGYTYLRDGGDRWGVGAAARAIAPEYGITYRTPLAPLHKQGHYGSFIGTGWEDIPHYARLVADHKAKGADFIKIMISGLMDFDRFGVLTQPGLDGDEIHALTAIAHEAGLSVMAHCNGAETALAAAQSGVDSIEHGAYLNAEALAAMAEKNVVWVPTLSTVGNLRGTGRFSEPAVQQILESAMENAEYYVNLGGLVAPGTDAGAWAVPHGIQTEEALLRQALGERTEDILRRGTAAIIAKF